MSQKIKATLLQALPVIVIATLLVVAIIYAWTEPPYGGVCADPPCPPGGNVPAPINVGDSTQYKSGALGIGGLFRGYSNAVFDGNVGIGTASPGTKLEVAGQIKITGGSPGSGKVLTSDASGLASWQTPAAGGVGGSGTANYLAKWTAGTTLGNSQIYDNGTNVGIGTAGPGAKLHVYGGKIYVSDAGSNTGIQIAASWIGDHYDGILHIQSGGSVVAFDGGDTVRISNLTNCNTIDTDASGNLHCGTDEKWPPSCTTRTATAGGGGREVAVSCAAGETVMSGGCSCAPDSGVNYLTGFGLSGNGWWCQCRSTYVPTASVRCCW